jgi:hypothetical protein
MAALLLAPVGAVLLALLFGGSLAAWGHCHVLWWQLALLSLAVQAILFTPPFDSYPPVVAYGAAAWIAAQTATTLALARNAVAQRKWFTAWSVAALGAGLNLLVIAANGGVMPQSPEAQLATRGEALPVLTEPRLRNVAPTDEQSRLPWLGDVLPQPTWLPRPNPMSIGDVLLSAGLAWWAFAVTNQKSRTRARAPAHSD